MFIQDKNKNNETVILANISIILIIIAVLLYCFSDGISGNDFWWHVKVGEWIYKNHDIPTVDIFSWYGIQEGISWTAHEWLADVIFYLIHTLLGDSGIYILSIIAAFIMTYLLWSQSKEYVKKNILAGGLFFALFTVVASLFFYGRPHVFSYFLLFFELKILYEFFEEPKSKKIYFLPMIACLWSNLHGGSSNLSYILCIVFLIAGILKLKCGKIVAERLNRKAIIILSVVSLLTAASILINPIGLKVIMYPYISQSNTLMMSVISEWQAPDAKSIGNIILYYFPIVLMGCGFVTEEKNIRCIDLMVMGIFLFLFFRSARFIMLWYIAVPFCAFRYLQECKVKEIKRVSEKVIVYTCIVSILIFSGVSFFEIVSNIKDDSMISKVMTDEMIKQVKEDSPKRLFNDYNLGEALIYNDIYVFFDARADLYAEKHIFENGVSLMYLEQANSETNIKYVDVEKLIDEYGFDAILIVKSRPLYSYLKSHQERFVCIYEDETTGYFKILEN